MFRILGQFVRRAWAFILIGWALLLLGAWMAAPPWDDDPRRPSHADERRAWRRELLGEEIRAALRPGGTERDILAIAGRLLDPAG